MLQLKIMKITYLPEKNPERPILVSKDIQTLLNKGFQVEFGSGLGQHIYSDSDYIQAGAKLSDESSSNGLIIKLHIDSEFLKNCPDKSSVLGICKPFLQPDIFKTAIEKKINLLSLEMIPRSTLAQSMDVLSSQANLSGYQAVIEACTECPKLLPLMMTPAGTLAPCKVLVLGAGVAGLQAIATAKRLGAVVQAYDPREAAQEQIESLGAKSLKLIDKKAEQTKDGYAKAMSEEDIAQQQKALTKFLTQSDIVISTAQVFGKKAPILINKEMLNAIKSPCVLIDLAAETGGNIEGSKANQTVKIGPLTLIGDSHLARKIPESAAQMLSKNISELLLHIYDVETSSFKTDNEIYSAIQLTHNGEIVNGLFKEVLVQS